MRSALRCLLGFLAMCIKKRCRNRATAWKTKSSCLAEAFWGVPLVAGFQAARCSNMFIAFELTKHHLKKCLEFKMISLQHNILNSLKTKKHVSLLPRLSPLCDLYKTPRPRFAFAQARSQRHHLGSKTKTTSFFLELRLFSLNASFVVRRLSCFFFFKQVGWTIDLFYDLCAGCKISVTLRWRKNIHLPVEGSAGWAVYSSLEITFRLMFESGVSLTCTTDLG